MFAAGIALILDIALPKRTELLLIDQHTSQTQTEPVALGWLKNDDDDGDGISIRIG